MNIYTKILSLTVYSLLFSFSVKALENCPKPKCNACYDLVKRTNDYFKDTQFKCEPIQSSWNQCNHQCISQGQCNEAIEEVVTLVKPDNGWNHATCPLSEIIVGKK